MNNKYSVACITLVRDKYKINTDAVRQTVLWPAWYIWPIRFENSIQNRIGRPIRFQIRFERKKNDSQVPNYKISSSSSSSRASNHHAFYRSQDYYFQLGTCESFFCVRIESRIESAVRFNFESNFQIEWAIYTTQAVTPSNELHRYLFCICHERE